MKKFNLKLAEAGCPLVTVTGKEVLFFIKTNINKSYPYIVMFKGCNSITLYNVHGRVYEERVDQGDLFLADVEWEPELKMGDIIQVAVDIRDESNWEDRIFIKHGVNNGILAVIGNSRSIGYKNYVSDEEFNTCTWSSDRWRRKPKTEDIKIEFTLNGEPFDASTLSDKSIVELIRGIKK